MIWRGVKDFMIGAALGVVFYGSIMLFLWWFYG